MGVLKLLAAAVLAVWAARGFADGEQRFAEIGDLPLEGGGTIHGCRIGYRTFGRLDAQKDNAVLVPTWFLGTSGDLASSFGPGRLIDSSKYFVIAVDALGNGVSSSPSNSTGQHDADFPAIAVRDMVESQFRMLGRIGIPHLRAVAGISMGGMQAFQWAASHPEFVDYVIPVVGSPRPTSYDLMFAAGGLEALHHAEGAEDSQRGPLIRTFADFFWMALCSPTYYVRHTKREQAIRELTGFQNALLKWDPNDMACDLDAIFRHNVYAPFGDDEAKAAATIRAKMLIVVASQDHCVNPAPALSLAKLVRARTIVMSDDDGHQSVGPEAKVLSPAIERLLEGR